ncbi:amidohydrolase family protein [Jiella sp. MQZ9-1]|uniref:Amidohydrolase family protein n=1 Tax=Jiella flava TaxID=2816857 RepID=A0A939JX67_9HYPH|nr:amidohydrolase family protein [Jiella flava]MBO0664279.1 amidohydrolase family protein [Jiella flava]MCD2472798.1 amidohydrolase family protein [Jiella flava]
MLANDAPFVIRNLRLPDGRAGLSVRVEGGCIAALETEVDTDGAEVLDAQGALMVPGFTDAHVHLDKALILGRCPICEGTLSEAVRLTAAAKAGFTAEDVHARGAEVLEMAVRAGTLRMRSFAEVDPRVGLRAFEGVLQLARDFADLIEVQVCVFAQEGLTQEPETLALLAEALAAGADLVGGCPYTDTDPPAHVRAIFDLAEQFDVDVDFHADFDLDPEGTILPVILAETEARGWQGRVTVGHATKFASFPEAQRQELARAMARAGVGLVVLPATDSFLNAAGQGPMRPRGMAPAAEIAGLGATVALATNNVENPFTPFGDAALLRMAQYYAHLDQLGSETALAGVWRMISSAAQEITGLAAPGIAVGQSAEFVLLAARTEAEAIRRNAPVTGVVRGGRVRLWRPEPVLMRDPRA